jgi:SAM-dependent methyltransferase
MVFRPRFDCLWCGSPWATRLPQDLEGWAQLCPDCLGKAGSNPFLRGRLRAALSARSSASGAAPAVAAPGGTPRAGTPPAVAAPGGTPRAGPPAAFPDDWFMRRGSFARGAVHDTAWQAELDAAVRWLDGQDLAGRILEPAAGVGFFSPLLAGKGELHAQDADPTALDLARARLVAHHLRAHLHPAPVDAPPDDTPPFDAIVAAFVLGRVHGPGLEALAGSLRARLRSGGRLVLVELLPDPAGGPPPAIAWTWHHRDLVAATLRRAGFGNLETASTGRFFQLLSAEAL